MKQKWLARLLALTLLLSLFPVSALAAEGDEDGETPVACAGYEADDTCAAETHVEGCPLYVAPSENEDDGDSNNFYELDDVIDGEDGIMLTAEGDGTTGAMSGNCGAEGNESSVTWALTVNNEDASNPTYTLTISGSGAMANYSALNEQNGQDNATGFDPPTWKSYPVTKVIVEEGVTTVGNRAFYDMGQLETVEIAASVETLGLRAINWSSAKEIKFAENSQLKTISFAALNNLSNLEAITIPANVESIGSWALANNKNLKKVTFEGSQLKTVGYSSFGRCGSSLNQVILPNGVETIGNAAFQEISPFSLFVPSTVTTMSGWIVGNSKDCTIYFETEDVHKKYPAANTPAAITNGGTFPEETTFESGKLASPVKDGYIFDGWYYTPKGENETKVEADTTLTEGTTYTAKWERAEGGDYTVTKPLTFTGNYGSAIVGQTITATKSEETNPTIKSATSSNSSVFVVDEIAEGSNTVTVTPAADLTAGTYTGRIYVTTGDDVCHFVPVTVVVSKSGSTVTPGENSSSITAVYGDTITLTAKTQRAETGIALMAALDEVDFLCGTTLLGSADVSYDGQGVGTATLKYDTSKGGIPVGYPVTITASYGGSVNLNGSFTNEITVTLSKAAQTAPAVPTMSSNSSNSITLNTVGANANGAAAEYSKDDGATWQSSPEFTGLSSGTSYTFAVRYAETANYAASPASTTASFSTTSGGSSSGGSSSGSSSGSTTYTVSVDSGKNGSVSVSPKNASKGSTVTVTVKPDSGYELDELTVTGKEGKTVKLTDKGNGKYTFTMPASKVTVEASFAEINEQLGTGFVDVPANAYYADAVAWAVENGITSGTSATTFSPNASCTRAQMVTFLWRAAGSPAPKAESNPFTDLDAHAYYYDAVLWAAEQGITSGTSATTFSPDATLTRGQTVTFLYRANGSPAASGSSFADVAADAYYANAVAWAVDEEITSGTGNNAFSPDADCTRGQIVTFMFRNAQ